MSLGFLIALFALAVPSAHAAFPGANGKIAVHYISGAADPEENIYVVNPDGTGLTALTTWSDPYSALTPAWSPDGARLAYARFCFEFGEDYCGSSILVLDLGTGTTSQLTNTSGTVRDQDPAWSPDGSKIAFSTNRDGDPEIYTMTSSGASQTDITNSHPSAEVSPAWSPDGAKIAFRKSGQIYTMNADGSGVSQLTVSPNQDDKPNWSPDGQKIAFTRDISPGGSEVYVMNADGTGQQNLSNDPQSENVDPAWSPDGTKIAWSKTDPDCCDNFEDIWTMNSDGTGKVPLGQNSSTHLDWQPLLGSYPPPPYGAPRSASPIRASLVPLFKQCGSGGNPSNSKHAAPLGVNSCNPPRAGSMVAVVGPASQSSASFGVMPSNPSTPTNEADVALEADLGDIQTPAGADYDPNPSGADLTAYARVRLTDVRSCTPAPCSGPYDKAATAGDVFLAFPVDCAATTWSTTYGSSCFANTSANALTPGFAQEGKGTIVQSFRFLVDDSGANGVRGDSDDRIFMTQGIFSP